MTNPISGGTCKLGTIQSPIDIKGATPANLPPIQFNYKASTLRIVDTGHTIQVNFDPGNTIAVAGETYELKQFQFHQPSEEKINGKGADMVVHLVHTNAAGKYAVVAVLLRRISTVPAIKDATKPPEQLRGAPRLLEPVFSNIPHETEHVVVTNLTINPADLLPVNRGYYTYQGSLTTPPCSEQVTWFVMKNLSGITGEQYNEFTAVYKNNSRPVQPLNGRTIEVSQ